MNGGPGTIRTPDPQIRSLITGIESKGKYSQPTLKQAVSNQSVTDSVQTENTIKAKEKPGAADTATGLDDIRLMLPEQYAITNPLASNFPILSAHWGALA